LSFTEFDDTFRTGSKSVLADVTEGISRPEYIGFHETSSCLVVDGQAEVDALGKPNRA